MAKSIIKGTSKNDTIIITKSNKTINAGKGNDRITVKKGKNNILNGQNGNDIIIIQKTAGTNNKLYGSYGNDKLYGNKYNDYLSGGNGNDLLKGGAGNDTLVGRKGNDKLYGGAGIDTFIFESGHDIIFDFNTKNDKLRIKNATVKNYETSRKDVILNFTNGSTLTIKNTVGKTITYTDAKKKTRKLHATATPLSIMRSFMQSLSEFSYTEKTITKALNAAVNYASGGKFTSWNNLISNFTNSVKNHGSKTQNENGTVDDPATKKYLQNYCGINLDNNDSGAITGKDAGGTKRKTKESIIPESNISNLKTVTKEKNTIAGVTFHWAKTTNKTEKFIQNCIYTWWAKNGLKLINDSYGLSFTSKHVTVKDIYIKFNNNRPTPAWTKSYYNSITGKTNKLELTFNKNYWKNIDYTNSNGQIKNKSDKRYLDETIAHELTHAVMAANIKNCSSLPICLREGSAELTAGVDTEYDYAISGVADAADTANLKKKLSSKTVTSTSYYGGYTMLRYFAKQSADYINKAYKDIVNSTIDFPSMHSVGSYDATNESPKWIIPGITTVGTDNLVSFSSNQEMTNTMTTKKASLYF